MDERIELKQRLADYIDTVRTIAQKDIAHLTYSTMSPRLRRNDLGGNKVDGVKIPTSTNLTDYYAPKV